jgi:Concanavalin A-like lectin/glucanases superfamily
METGMNGSGLARCKAKSLLGAIAVLVVLASMVSNAPAQPPPPGLQYTFDPAHDDPTVSGGIKDQSGNGHDGTVINSNVAELVAGPSGNMNGLHIDYANFADETDGSGINTGTKVDNTDVNIFLGPFTAMAWCNLDDFNGDHMVFGTPRPMAPGAGSNDAGALHMGFRGSQIYMGYWGASVNRDASSPSGLFQVGEWHHFAWRFDGAGTPGAQDIFFDGVLVVDHQGAPFYGDLLKENNNVPNVATNLLIGRTVSNSGAFSGMLSDVRVYNVAVADADIATIAASPP